MAMGVETILRDDAFLVSETDAKGVILFANEQFCNAAEYLVDELLGKPHNLVRHQDMPKAAFKDLWQTVQSGKVWNGIVKNKTKNGGYYWVNATAYPSKNSNGELRYVSVRVKPTDEEISNAISLYKTLN